jgi:hypothetical protein
VPISHLGTWRQRIVAVRVMMRVMILLATDCMQAVAACPHIFQTFEAAI